MPATPNPRNGSKLRRRRGAPNVVIVLIDAIGFGHSSAFGGNINMPTLQRLSDGSLKYNRFDTTALCSPPAIFDGVARFEPPTTPCYHFTTDVTDKAINWLSAQHTLTPDKPYTMRSNT
jgi:arylsulfatase A-like enzyme